MGIQANFQYASERYSVLEAAQECEVVRDDPIIKHAAMTIIMAEAAILQRVRELDDDDMGC